MASTSTLKGGGGGEFYISLFQTKYLFTYK